MTREHKVALIVGFSLILLIAVLLSDHLSRARSARLEPIREGEYALSQPDAPVDPLVSLDSTPTVSEPPAEAAPAVTESPALTDGTAASPAPSTELALGPAPAADAAASDARLAADIARLGGTLVPGAGGTIILPPPAAPSTESRPESPADAAPPPSAPPVESIRLHPVQKGENLYRIAEKYYGSGAQWKKLADANRDRVAANGSVREGVQLRIPGAPATSERTASKPTEKPADKPAARPSKPAAKPGPMRIARGPEPAPPSRTPGRSARTYKVVRGDTLGGIAVKTLGTSRRAGEIMALNGIDDADEISAGVVLKIPG